MTKPTKWTVHPAKTKISLDGCPGWSEPSQCVQWVAKDPVLLQADSEDSDQTARLSRLIWVFAGHTGHFDGYINAWTYYQIAEKVAEVKEVQDRLGKVWQDRKDYHDQLYDFHIFLRDTNQLNNISSSQEVREQYYWITVKYAQVIWCCAKNFTGFPQALENMENDWKKFHAWKNHGIWKLIKNYGILGWDCCLNVNITQIFLAHFTCSTVLKTSGFHFLTEQSKTIFLHHELTFSYLFNYLCNISIFAFYIAL